MNHTKYRVWLWVLLLVLVTAINLAAKWARKALKQKT